MICLMFLVLTGSGQSEELRLWRSSNKEYTVEAKYIGYSSESKKATLERRNGNLIQVALDDLSEDDQDYVRAKAKINKEEEEDAAFQEELEKESREAQDRKPPVRKPAAYNPVYNPVNKPGTNAPSFQSPAVPRSGKKKIFNPLKPVDQWQKEDCLAYTLSQIEDPQERDFLFKFFKSCEFRLDYSDKFKMCVLSCTWWNNRFSKNNDYFRYPFSSNDKKYHVIDVSYFALFSLGFELKKECTLSGNIVFVISTTENDHFNTRKISLLNNKKQRMAYLPNIDWEVKYKNINDTVFQNVRGDFDMFFLNDQLINIILSNDCHSISFGGNYTKLPVSMKEGQYGNGIKQVTRAYKILIKYFTQNDI